MSEKQLILKCVLAKTDNYVQNKPALKPPCSPAMEAALEIDDSENKHNPYSDNDFKHGATLESNDQSRPESRPADFEKAARHPLSVDNITLPSAQDFFQLLAKQGYYLNQLQGNKKTFAMVHQWVQAKVTLEEAQIGINHANAQQSPKPETPYYYLKPVLQVRSDFDKAQQQANEVKHAKPQPTQSVNQRYPKSATKQFWERQEEIMRGIADASD